MKDLKLARLFIGKQANAYSLSLQGALYALRDAFRELKLAAPEQSDHQLNQELLMNHGEQVFSTAASIYISMRGSNIDRLMPTGPLSKVAHPQEKKQAAPPQPAPPPPAPEPEPQPEAEAEDDVPF